MSSQESEPESRVVGVLLIAAILLAVGLALGFGISRAGSSGVQTAEVQGTLVVDPGAIVSAAASAAADDVVVSVAAPVVVAAESDDASVLIEDGVVKMYFSSGKYELASGALMALGDAIDAAKSGKRLVVSGFHDDSGDPAMNAALAKKRANSVREALLGAGVPASALDLKKPEQAVGGANAAEARRVEVTIVG